jgi:drug/metabolite transporter (DMT)-like permease
VLLGFATYAVFAAGDSFIKAVGHEAGVFSIAFFVTLFAGPFFWLARPAEERWRDFWKMRYPLLVNLRAAAGIAAGILGINAFTRLPLAEVYALVFLMPAFVSLLAWIALGERPGPARWLAILVGFAGVLLAVRPGFREVGPAHLGGVFVAVAGAVTVTILRRIAAEEKRTAIFGTIFLWGLVVNGILMLPGFAWPSAGQFLLLALAGACTGTGQLLILLASRRAPAASVAPTQYSQLAWAVVFGALFFAEVPDALTLAGLGLVALSGLIGLFGPALFLPRRRLPA